MNRRLFGVALLSLSAAGCGQELETEYGRRTGAAAVSVNGTSVLADMFKEAGHSISGASWAGPNLAKGADVIVWFPNSFRAPEARQRQWFETWMCAEPGRMLVYVGRDYDAAITYWSTALKLIGKTQQDGNQQEGEQREIVRRMLERENVRFNAARLAMPRTDNCGWFNAVRKMRHRDIHELSGDSPWLVGLSAQESGAQESGAQEASAKQVDVAGFEIELNGRLLPGKGAHSLLVSEPDVLVSEKAFAASKLVVVANGSFLLNLPLVNHEHRKLAGKLIESVGSQRRIAFLESGPDGLEVYDEEPGSVGRSGLAILVTEPFDIPILHLAVAGIIFCLARFPIFGRPRGWQPDALVDFGAHIAALGKLLAATKDRAFALAAIGTYQRTAHVGTLRGGRQAPPPKSPSTVPLATTEDPRLP